MPNMDPMVSIQCMTYNHAPYIEDAMNGFCMQETTFPFVAIIVDDASTDGEQDVIKTYLNSHFDIQNARTWETDDACFIAARHKKNQKCFFVVVLLKYNFWQAKKSKEPIIREWTETKYVALCEGDDYWTHPNKLQMQVELLEKYQDCSFCVHNYMSLNEEISVFFEPQLGVLSDKSTDSILRLGMNDYLTKGFFTKTLTCVYRKESLVKSNFRYYPSKFDMNMFFALMTQGNCCFISERMGCYREHQGGITKGSTWETFVENVLPKLFDIIRIEKSDESRHYIYNHMRNHIVAFIQTRNYRLLWLCIKNLGLKWNIFLFFVDVPSQIFSIIINKIKKCQ